MLNNIKKLPQNVINQISAGEVVERPANMFKELIENALDAGADKINIHFTDGGLSLQIKDNGTGIQSHDMGMALSPHSTSKLKNLNDLWGIQSYGFRGEALASIAEVSDLTLISKPKNQKKPARLKSCFGKKQELQHIGGEDGTTVIIKDLFKNIPARYKFLKSPASETSLIKNTLKAFALARPDVEFRVLNKNKLLFFWPKCKNIKERAMQVLSLKDPSYINTKYMDVNVCSVFCPPHETAPTRRSMWFFVENRWVEDKTLHSAVMSAYRGLLMHGEYPMIVLKIAGLEGQVDVNVHPAKSQVRFKDSSLVFRAVHHSLRAVLEKAPWVKTVTENTHPDTQENMNFADKKFSKTHLPQKQFPDFKYAEKPENVIPAIKSMRVDQVLDSVEEPQSLTTPTLNGEWASLNVLAQAHLTYIITESQNKIIFIDQHAAHERILYERLMKIWRTGKGDIQNRLVPLCLDLEEDIVSSLFSIKKDLSKMGLSLEKAGAGGIVIKSAPCLLKDGALQKTLLKLGEDVKSQGESFALSGHISDIFADMACHSAIRAGQALSVKEMKNLLNQMDEFALSSFCPHGRPVFVEYPISRLEKDFGRRV